MNFQLFEHPNKLIKRFDEWADISDFSVITGKNGVGKSTVMTYFKDVINEFYKAINSYSSKSIDQTEKDKIFSKIVQFNEYINMLEISTEKKKLKINHLYIPVVYKMHETIKPDLVGLNELKKIMDDFFFKLDKITLKESQRRASDFYKKSIDIFSVKSIEELILQFRNKEKFINKHLSDFKYEIRIYDENPPRIKFKERKQEISDIYPDEELDASNLSPGEQLMLMFRLWEFALTRFEIPHTPVLLLDEPDAHLHPKAVKDFVQILEKLAKSGAQIIMTTHNPTTVSLVNKENLFCMKKMSTGLMPIESKQLKTETSMIKTPNNHIVIEKATSKPQIIGELTDSLIIVNEPFRVVFVEGEPHKTNLSDPEYNVIERDAIFYRFIYGILSEKPSKMTTKENNAAKNNDNPKFKDENEIDIGRIQLVFKSFIGNENILEMLRRLEAGLLYRDHCGIIDNDNYFAICKNTPNEINEYYSNISKNVYNLLRNSLENYILDPINFFCYLNYFRLIRESTRYEKNSSCLDNNFNKNSTNDYLEVNLEKLNSFYEKIAFNMNIKLEEFKCKYGNITSPVGLDTNSDLFQSVVEVMGNLIIDYLTKKSAFSYRLFECPRSSYIQNLTPLLRFVQNQECSAKKPLSKKKTNDRNHATKKSRVSSDFKKAKTFRFCSVGLVRSINLNQIQWPEQFQHKWKTRCELLHDKKREAESKAKELDSLKDDFSKLKSLQDYPKYKDLMTKNRKYSLVFQTHKRILRSEAFQKWKAEKTHKNESEDLKNFLENNFQHFENESESMDEEINQDISITKEELKLYVSLKQELDECIIGEVRNYLQQTVDCCFHAYEHLLFKYPLVFYMVNGHYLEEILHDLFFNGKYYKARLVDPIMREDGLIKKRGFVVPNELSEIFKRIVNIDNELRKQELRFQMLLSEISSDSRTDESADLSSSN